MRWKPIPITFTSREGASLLLNNGAFSLTRFKRCFKEKARAAILGRFFSNQDGVVLAFGRVAIRNLNPHRQNNFVLDVSVCSADGKCEWRQVFLYAFSEPGKSLNGILIPGRRRYAKKR